MQTQTSRIFTSNINQGTKFGSLKKPIFSFFHVTVFWFSGIVNKIFRAWLPVSNIINYYFPSNSHSPLVRKKGVMAPSCYSRKYSMWSFYKEFILKLVLLFATLMPNAINNKNALLNIDYNKSFSFFMQIVASREQGSEAKKDAPWMWERCYAKKKYWLLEREGSCSVSLQETTLKLWKP